MENNQLVFTKINNEYIHIKYNDTVEIIIMINDRYVNVSKLCDKYGKNLDEWFDDPSNKKQIEAVNNIINYTSQNCRIVIDDLEIVTGSYVHELLIPYIGNWIEPTLGIIINEIIHNYTYNENARLFKEKNKVIKKLKLMVHNATKRGEIGAMFTT